MRSHRNVEECAETTTQGTYVNKCEHVPHANSLNETNASFVAVITMTLFIFLILEHEDYDP